MFEILWHLRETKRQKEITNLNLQQEKLMKAFFAFFGTVFLFMGIVALPNNPIRQIWTISIGQILMLIILIGVGGISLAIAYDSFKKPGFFFVPITTALVGIYFKQIDIKGIFTGIGMLIGIAISLRCIKYYYKAKEKEVDQNQDTENEKEISNLKLVRRIMRRDIFFRVKNIPQIAQMSHYRYRLIFFLIGVSLPYAILLLGIVVTIIPFVYFLWYPIYLAIMAPGFLYPGKGYLTILLCSVVWGTIGFIAGYLKDRQKKSQNLQKSQNSGSTKNKNDSMKVIDPSAPKD